MVIWSFVMPYTLVIASCLEKARQILRWCCRILRTFQYDDDTTFAVFIPKIRPGRPVYGFFGVAVLLWPCKVDDNDASPFSRTSSKANIWAFSPSRGWIVKLIVFQGLIWQLLSDPSIGLVMLVFHKVFAFRKLVHIFCRKCRWP